MFKFFFWRLCTSYESPGMANSIAKPQPIGIFALMAWTVSKHGLAVLLPLGKLIVLMYVAVIIHVCVVYLPLIKSTGISLRTFFKVLAEPLLIAFSTTSSAAALPCNMQAARKLGASKSITSFSLPLGNTINMDGSAIYIAIATIFAAEVYNIPMNLSNQLTILLIGLLATIGTAGVPGGVLVMITVLFTQIVIPLEAIAIIAGIDRIMDMTRTPVNITGDITCALIVSKLEGEFGKDEFTEAHTK